MIIHLNGFVGKFTQLTEPTFCISGAIGDWQWEIENFGMSWGIRSTFDEAYSAFVEETASIQKDFDVSDAEIYAMERDRVCNEFSGFDVNVEF